MHQKYDGMVRVPAPSRNSGSTIDLVFELPLTVDNH